MKHAVALSPLLLLFASNSAFAQETAESAAAAAEEVIEDRPIAPAPPPIRIAPAEVAESADRFMRYVTPLDYDAIRPRPDDYPLDAWRADEEGRVEYKLTVDPEGSPTSCNIVVSSGSAALDKASCAVVMERAKFDPARDEAGDPIEGVYEDAHYWRKREPEFPGTMKVHVAFTVDETGQSSDCEVIEVSGSISEQMRKSFEREPCPGINRPARAIYRDDAGNPVARRVELVFDVKVEDPAE